MGQDNGEGFHVAISEYSHQSDGLGSSTVRNFESGKDDVPECSRGWEVPGPAVPELLNWTFLGVMLGVFFEGLLFGYLPMGPRPGLMMMVRLQAFVKHVHPFMDCYRSRQTRPEDAPQHFPQESQVRLPSFREKTKLATSFSQKSAMCRTEEDRKRVEEDSVPQSGPGGGASLA